MTVAAEAGLDLSMFAQLGVKIDSLTSEMRSDRLARQQRAAEMWKINVQCPTWNGAAPFDLGQPTMGPPDGYAWAVYRVTAATFTGGVVNMYQGMAADNNLLFQFTSAGVFWQQFILGPKDRLTFAPASGSTITGNVTISFDAVQMTTRMLPEFLV